MSSIGSNSPSPHESYWFQLLFGDGALFVIGVSVWCELAPAIGLWWLLFSTLLLLEFVEMLVGRTAGCCVASAVLIISCSSSSSSFYKQTKSWIKATPSPLFAWLMISRTRVQHRCESSVTLYLDSDTYRFLFETAPFIVVPSVSSVTVHQVIDLTELWGRSNQGTTRILGSLNKRWKFN